MKRVLVTGSRNWTDEETIFGALWGALENLGPFILVHGDARGADRMAEQAARRSGLAIEAHPAKWRAHGVYNPQAGLLRNREMVELGADLCLAFIRAGSRGATHCANLAEEAGIPVVRFEVE